jgi:hypothetical protein
MELPKEKRPPDEMIWDGTTEEMEDWLERVIKKNEPVENTFVIDDVEG